MKVLLLIAIYSLHLVFIQVLMAEPSAQVMHSFKTFFSNATPKNQSHQPVTDYYSLHKHFNKQSRTEGYLSVLAMACPKINLYPKLPVTTGVQVIPPVLSSISDAVFKRYCRHCIFLI